MRCNKCNVDLGEEYTYCPLCGADAVDEPPKIEGMKTSEYPVVTYKNFPKSVTKYYFIVAAALVLVGGIIEKFVRGSFDISMFAAFVFPCIWSLVVRPIAKKYMNIGIFILSNTITFSLLILYVSSVLMSGFSTSISSGLPMLFLCSMTLTLLFALIFKDSRYDLVIYLFTFWSLALISLIITLVESWSILLPCIATAAGILFMLVLAILSPKEFAEEFKARFHA